MPTPSTSYTYDDEGNRTKRTKTSTGEVTEYEWDLRNRLTKATEEVRSEKCEGRALPSLVWVEVKAAAVEVDRSAKSFTAAKSMSCVLDSLNL